jgi:hypothetical protein
VLSAQHPGEAEGAYALRRFPRAVQRIDTHVSCPQFIHAANSPRFPSSTRDQPDSSSLTTGDKRTHKCHNETHLASEGWGTSPAELARPPCGVAVSRRLRV